jgi:uncharacterized protein (TIGR03067 family)
LLRGLFRLSDFFGGDRWLFTEMSDVRVHANRDPPSAGVLQVNPSANPQTIDRAKRDGSRRHGVYRVVGDELVWAWDEGGVGRPSSFDPAEGVIVWTLRRVKK